MKKLAIFSLVITLILTGCSSGATPSKIVISNNLGVDELTKGMVYDVDFNIGEDYMNAFVKTVNCSDITINEGEINYTISNSVDTPYFLWVCYPQITKSSQSRVIAMEVKNDNSMTVMAFFKKDTDDSLFTFGGTYGTKNNGW